MYARAHHTIFFLWECVCGGGRGGSVCFVLFLIHMNNIWIYCISCVVWLAVSCGKTLRLDITHKLIDQIFLTYHFYRPC